MRGAIQAAAPLPTARGTAPSTSEGKHSGSTNVRVAPAANPAPISGMHLRRVLLPLLAGVALSTLPATEILPSVAEVPAALFAEKPREIDPDQQVYGLKFGATEEELVAAFGRPTGVVRIDPQRVALLYGRRHAFVLNDGKFTEMQISEQPVFAWELGSRMEGHPFFDSVSWSLQPGGVLPGMKFTDVAKALGAKLGAPGPKATFLSKNAQVELGFEPARDAKGAVRAFSLANVWIRWKAP